MEKYTCEIIESSKELTAKERVWIKNNTDAIKINKNIVDKKQLNINSFHNYQPLLIHI